MLADQQAYFQELKKLVTSAKSQVKTPSEMEARVPALREEVLKNASIARYVGDGFTAQVEKVWVEMGGGPFASSPLALSKEQHERHHGLGHERR